MKLSPSSSSITTDSSLVITFSDLVGSNSVMDPTTINEALASFYKLGGDFNREEYRFLLQLMIKNCVFPLLQKMLDEAKVSHILVRQLITSEFLYHLMLSKKYKANLFRLLISGNVDGESELPYSMFHSYLLPEEYIRFNEEDSVINQEGLFSYQDEMGDTALHIAARKKDVISLACLLLLSNKFEVPTANKQGENPLHIACRLGHFSSISLLLRYYPTLLEQKNSANQLPYEVCPNYQYTLDKIIWEYISRILKLHDVLSGDELDYAKLKDALALPSDEPYIQTVENKVVLFNTLVTELIAITKTLASTLSLEKCNKDQNAYRFSMLFLLIYSTHNLYGYYKVIENKMKAADKTIFSKNMQEWNASILIWLYGYRALPALGYVPDFKFPSQLSFENNPYFLCFMVNNEKYNAIQLLDSNLEGLYRDLKQVLLNIESLLKEKILVKIPDLFLKLMVFEIEKRIQKGQEKKKRIDKKEKILKIYYIGKKQYKCFELLSQLYQKYSPLENRKEIVWLYAHIINRLWLEADFDGAKALSSASNLGSITENLNLISRLLIRKKYYMNPEEFAVLSDIERNKLEFIQQEIAKKYLSILNLKRFGKKYKLAKNWKVVETSNAFEFALELTADSNLAEIKNVFEKHVIKYSLENNLLVIHDPAYNEVETFMLALFEVLKTNQTKKKTLSYASSSSNPYANQEEKIFQLNTALEEKYPLFAKWQLSKKDRGAMIQLSDEDCSKVYIGLNKAGYQPERRSNQIIIPAIHQHLVDDLIKVLVSAISPETSLEKEETLPQKEEAGAAVVPCSSEEDVKKQSEETLLQEEEVEQEPSTASQDENIPNLPMPSFYPVDKNYSHGNSEISEDETDESVEGIDLHTFISKLKEACNPKKMSSTAKKKQKKREKQEQESQQEKLINEALTAYKGSFFKSSDSPNDSLARVFSEPTTVAPAIASEENETTASLADCSLGIAESIEEALPSKDTSADKDSYSSHNEKGEGERSLNQEQSFNQGISFKQATREHTFFGEAESTVLPSENFSSIPEDDSDLDSLEDLTQSVFNFLEL